MIFQDTRCTYSHYYCFFQISSHLPESSLMREKSLSVTFCSTSFSSLSSSPNHSSFRPRMLSMISLGEIPMSNAAIATSHNFSHDGKTRYIWKTLYNKQSPKQKTGLPKIYESLKSNPNINCNDNKEEQPMTIGVTPTHADSWVDRSGKTEIQDGTYSWAKDNWSACWTVGNWLDTINYGAKRQVTVVGHGGGRYNALLISSHWSMSWGTPFSAAPCIFTRQTYALCSMGYM